MCFRMSLTFLVWLCSAASVQATWDYNCLAVGDAASSQPTLFAPSNTLGHGFMSCTPTSTGIDNCEHGMKVYDESLFGGQDPKVELSVDGATPQMLQVNMKGFTRVRQVDVVWGKSAMPSSYKIQASLDGTTWRDIHMVNLTAINQAVGDHTASNTAFPVTVRTSLVTGPSGSPELFKVESNFSSTQRGFEFASRVRVWFDTMYPGQTNTCTGLSTQCVELWQLIQYSVDNLCPYTTPTAQSSFSVFAYTYWFTSTTTLVPDLCSSSSSPTGYPSSVNLYGCDLGTHPGTCTSGGSCSVDCTGATPSNIAHGSWVGACGTGGSGLLSHGSICERTCEAGYRPVGSWEPSCSYGVYSSATDLACEAVTCPQPGSTGLVPTGCTLDTGYMGDVVATTTGPLYYNSTVMLASNTASVTVSTSASSSAAASLSSSTSPTADSSVSSSFTPSAALSSSPDASSSRSPDASSSPAASSSRSPDASSSPAATSSPALVSPSATPSPSGSEDRADLWIFFAGGGGGFIVIVAAAVCYSKRYQKTSPEVEDKETELGTAPSMPVTTAGVQTSIPLDTTGDGKPDAIAIDTSGDGVPDRVLPLENKSAPAPLKPSATVAEP